MSKLFGFLEQVAGRSAVDPYGPPPGNNFEAIRDHLVILLNTRRGSIPNLVHFGLPDFSDIYKGYPDSLFYLGAEIKRSIDMYEPRLTAVKVRLISSSSHHFEANYAITGHLLESDGTGTEVTFRTMVTQGGKTFIDKN